MTQLVPESIREFVQVRQGLVPKRSQATGAQAGDAIYGGWWYYAGATATTHNCSFAFPGRYSNKNVMLTAAHCGFPYYIQQTGHQVRLNDTPLAEYGVGPVYGNSKYDFEVHDITGLATGPYVWFDNNSITHPPGYTYGFNNTVPGYQEEGYFRLVGEMGFYSQFEGDPVCKSGRSTGFTCGMIVDDNATWHNTPGWIRWGQSEQEIVGYPGDSGGAVFQMDPNPGDVIALGVLSGVTIKRDASGNVIPCQTSLNTDCTVVHMPIDYVRDHLPTLTLMTASQN